MGEKARNPTRSLFIFTHFKPDSSDAPKNKQLLTEGDG